MAKARKIYEARIPAEELSRRLVLSKNPDFSVIDLVTRTDEMLSAGK